MKLTILEFMTLDEIIRRCHEISDPHLMFRGMDKRQFLMWLMERNYDVDPTLEDHKRSVKATIRRLETEEMYEFCAIAKLYLDTLPCG